MLREYYNYIVLESAQSGIKIAGKGKEGVEGLEVREEREGEKVLEGKKIKRR